MHDDFLSQHADVLFLVIPQMGQIIGLGIVMTLQGTLSAERLESWGWRIPFLLALVVGTLVR